MTIAPLKRPRRTWATDAAPLRKHHSTFPVETPDVAQILLRAHCRPLNDQPRHITAFAPHCINLDPTRALPRSQTASRIIKVEPMLAVTASL